MPAQATRQELSDAIVQLANRITALGPGPCEREYSEFINGTPAQ